MSGTTQRTADEGEVAVPSRPEVPSNVLLLAPYLSEAAGDACRELMSVAPLDQQNLIYLAFTHAYAADLDRWLGADGASPESVLIVKPSPRETVAVEHERLVVETVASPGNLTEIGVALSKHLPEFERSPCRTVACVRSLTALLQYVDRGTAYQFLNVLTERLASIDAVAHYHLDPAAHDEQVVRTLSSLFDAVVEVDDDAALCSRRR